MTGSSGVVLIGGDEGPSAGVVDEEEEAEEEEDDEKDTKDESFDSMYHGDNNPDAAGMRTSRRLLASHAIIVPVESIATPCTRLITAGRPAWIFGPASEPLTVVTPPARFIRRILDAEKE